MKDIQQELEALALHVAKRAQEPDTAFQDTLDAFGKLTTYYGLLLKNQGKLPPDEVEPTMHDLLNDDPDESEEIPNGRSRRSPRIQVGGSSRSA